VSYGLISSYNHPAHDSDRNAHAARPVAGTQPDPPALTARRYLDQRLRLHLLRAADAIATHGSLLKASAALGLSQPGLKTIESFHTHGTPPLPTDFAGETATTGQDNLAKKGIAS